MTDSKSVRATGNRERTSPVTFYRQVVAELRKVVWPSQQQLITYFIVVVVFVLLVMGFRVVARPGLRQAGLQGVRLDPPAQARCAAPSRRQHPRTDEKVTE